MLLAVIQAESDWFAGKHSTFIAAVERTVCREEFDVLVLPTPSTACSQRAEKVLSSQLASYVTELSSRKHALIGFGVRTRLGHRVCCSAYAAYEGRLFTSSKVSSGTTMVGDSRACYVATEFARAGVFQDIVPDEGLLLADDHLHMFQLEDAQILMVSASHRKAGIETCPEPPGLRSSHRLNAYWMVAGYGVSDEDYPADHNSGGSMILSPNGHELVDAGTAPGLHVAEIPDFLPFHS